jgi:hypothetical protein
MNHLEREIAALPLLDASPDLDDRISAVLSDPVPATRSGALRSSAMVTIAAVCLLAGVFVGYAGAELRDFEGFTGRSQSAPGTTTAVALATSEQESPLLVAHLQDQRFDACQRCHQSDRNMVGQLDQLRKSARAGAALWERETGDTFLVLCHSEKYGFSRSLEKGVRYRKCEAPFGPFRFSVPDPVFPANPKS